MEEAKVVEIKESDGKTGYIIVGTRQQCVAKVTSLETEGEGYWFEIGYYERNPSVFGKSIHVWKFRYGKRLMAQLQSMRDSSQRV